MFKISEFCQPASHTLKHDAIISRASISGSHVFLLPKILAGCAVDTKLDCD